MRSSYFHIFYMFIIRKLSLFLIWYELTDVTTLLQLRSMRKDTQTLLSNQHQLIQSLNQSGMFHLANF